MDKTRTVGQKWLFNKLVLSFYAIKKCDKAQSNPIIFSKVIVLIYKILKPANFIFRALFVMALVVTVSYSISHNVMNNVTTTENLTSSNNLLKSTGLGLNSDSSDLNPAPLTDEETIKGIEVGNEAIKNRLISDTFTKPLPSPSPDFRHQFAVSTSLKADELALAGVAEIAATRKIENSRSLLGKPSSMGSYFNGGWVPKGFCKEFTKTKCEPTKYRTFDGSCNNPNQWGSAMSPYRRMLKPAYADGINSPRESLLGGPLPSAREVSLKVHPPSPSANPSFTVMLAVFGQFLDHDITATAISQGVNGSSLSCCSPVSNHPECFPVKVGPGDPVYDVGGISCMEFVRSAPAPQCKIGPRQQLNQVCFAISILISKDHYYLLIAKKKKLRSRFN